MLKYFGAELFTGPGQDSPQFSLEPAAVLVFLAVGLLLVMMFSALLLTISIYARSYKEAQSYIAPIYLGAILPVALINSIPGYTPDNWMFLVPAVNAVILFKEVLMGVYNFNHIALTAVSSAGFAAIAIFLAVRIYSKEEVLFK